MTRIVIIGSGNIGTRTLQSVLSVNNSRNLEIWIVDKSSDSLELAESRAREINHKAKLHCQTSLEGIPDECNLAVIATTSGPRFGVIKELLAVCRPQTLLLEKFLFQLSHQYDEIKTLTDKLGVKVYVNCPRPAWPGYIDLKKYVADGGLLEMTVTGTSWALASNAIHFVAAFQALTGQLVERFDGTELDNNPLENKRSGYLEISGTLKARTVRGDRLSLTSWAKGRGDIIVNVRTPNFQAVVFENLKKSLSQGEASNWQWVERPFELFYASQMKDEISALLDGEPCHLPTYVEIMPAHLNLIPIFNDIFFPDGWTDQTACPVT